jgi:hypothetical protein
MPKPHVAVICSDRSHLEKLMEMKAFDTSGCHWESYSSVDAFVNTPGSIFDELKVALLSQFGLEETRQLLEGLARVRNKSAAPALVELQVDDPLLAYRLLGHEAIHVVSSAIFRVERLWWGCMMTFSGCPQPFYKPVLPKVTRPAAEWGFMSMVYDVTKPDHFEYERAISPTMKRLRLELSRCDEVPTSELDLKRQIAEAIRNSQVVVVQVSSQSPWTIWEVGFAEGSQKQLLLLYRERSCDKPGFLQAYRHLEYCTATELALKLFFGLGGTMNDLLPEDRK